MTINYNNVDSNLKIFTYPVIAGALLQLLLPTGIWLGIGTVFSTIFILHIGLLICSITTSSYFIFKVFSKSTYKWTFFAWWLIVIVTITSIAALPIISRDALIHHLAVPKWWSNAGTISQISWHEWSYYPMLLDLGFTALLKLGLEVATPYYHFAYLLILSGAVATFVYNRTKLPNITLLSYLITLSIPICIKLSTMPLVDLGLAVYFAIAIFTLVYWSEHQESYYWLVISGLALGLAMSTKYNGLLGMVVFAFAAVFLLSRTELTNKQLLGILTAIITLSIITYMPWLIKNYYWTGNPVYPLYRNMLGGPALPTSIGGLSPLSQRRLLYGSSWLEILATPVLMLLIGIDDSPKYFDGVLSPILIIAVIPIFMNYKRPWVKFASIFCVLYTLFALVFSAARVRYLAPIFGPAIALSCTGLSDLTSNRSRYGKQLVALAVSVHVLFVCYYITNFLGIADAVKYLTSKTTRSEYLNSKISEQPITDYVNHNLPSNSHVYLLFTGGRFYYYDRTVSSGGYHSGDEIISWLRSTASPSSSTLYEEFKTRGITHIATNIVLTNKAFVNLLTDSEIEIWSDFIQHHTEPLTNLNPFTVWKLKP